jgi:hypothetical protein
MKDNLYIIRVFGREGNSVIKFGYSAVMNKRIESYRGHNPLLEIIGTYYREDAQDFEREFHKYHSSNKRYEWYEEEFLESIIYQIYNGIVYPDIDSEFRLKKCINCCTTKSVREFNNDKTTVDGFSYYCRNCRKLLRKKYQPVIQTHNKKWWNEFKNKEPNLYN